MKKRGKIVRAIKLKRYSDKWTRSYQKIFYAYELQK